MYCGDETGSFVGEIGTRNSRFGYGGQDAPCLVTPSYVSMMLGDDKPAVPSCCYNALWGEQRNLQTPMRTIETPETLDPGDFLAQGDCVQNWDAWEAMWRYSFDVLRTKDPFKHTSPSKKGLIANLKTEEFLTMDAVKPASSTLGGKASSTNDSRVTHPILVVAPGYTHSIGTRADDKREQKQLVELTERMMESLDCGALFVAPTPMLAAFSHGRQTCTVVDIGASGSRVTPVVDGLLLYNSQRRNGRGGDWLGNIQWHTLISRQDRTVLRPRYQVRNAKCSTNQIFHRWAVQDLMYEMRTSGCMKLSPTQPTFMPFDEANTDATMDVAEDGDPIHYELPDGTLVDLSTKAGKDLCRIPELLFSDSAPFLEGPNPVYTEHKTLSNAPLHTLVHESLSAVADIDVRKELASQIILTGSLSLTVDLDKRLSYELAKLFKSRVVFNKHTIEKQCAAWIGGSILTSLGSFQQLWLSKAEYDEYGAFLASQRFPL